MSDRLADLLHKGPPLDNGQPRWVAPKVVEYQADTLRAAFQSGPLEDRLALLREVWPDAAVIVKRNVGDLDPEAIGFCEACDGLLTEAMPTIYDGAGCLLHRACACESPDGDPVKCPAGCGIDEREVRQMEPLTKGAPDD